MWRLFALAVFIAALYGPLLFGEAADAADVPDAFIAVVNEKSAEAMGDIGVFRDQLFRDHATIMDQNNKIAELTKELEALKAVPPKAETPAAPTPPSGAMHMHSHPGGPPAGPPPAGPPPAPAPEQN